MTASAIGSVTRPRDEPWLERRGTRSLGALTAAMIALLAAGLALALGGDLFVLSAIPAAALVGAILGPSVWPGHSVWGAVAAMAALTVVVADMFVLVGLLVGAHLASGAAANADLAATIVGLGYIGLIGLVIVGVPMLIVTTPCAIAWALIVRHLVSHGHGVSGA